MATITVYRPTTDTSYSIDVTMEYAVLNNSGSGTNGYYIRLSTNQRDPLGQPISDRYVENFAANSNLTRVIQDLASEMIDEINGSELTSFMGSSLSSLNSSSSGGSGLSSLDPSSISSVSTSSGGSSRGSSQSTLNSSSSDSSDSSESSVLQGE